MLNNKHQKIVNYCAALSREQQTLQLRAPSAVDRRGFWGGGGGAMKIPRLRSEKKMATYLGLELDACKRNKIKNVLMAGFQPVLQYLLRENWQTHTAEMILKHPRISKSVRWS